MFIIMELNNRLFDVRVSRVIPLIIVIDFVLCYFYCW